MSILNKEEIDTFIWECTQLGGTATPIKATVDGEVVNIAWKCSVTNDAIAMKWDWEMFKQESRGAS